METVSKRARIEATGKENNKQEGNIFGVERPRTRRSRSSREGDI